MTTKRGDADEDQRQPRGRSTRRSPSARSAVAAAVDEPEQQPDRHEQQDRIVQVGGEVPGPPAALGASRRSDSRISALKAASMAPR